MVAIKECRAAAPPVSPLSAPAPRPPAQAPSPDFAASVADAIDLLVPRLIAFDAAAYLYMLRRSLIEAGAPHLRVSMRELRTQVVRPQYGRMVSFRSTQKALLTLEKIGAIRKEGEPNRAGTLYRIFPPDEIAACRAAKAERAAAAAPAAKPLDVQREVDHYNVRENRVRIFARDGWRCRYCAKQLTRQTATLDHVVPVAAGGGNGADNLVTACLACNSAKTGRAVGDFLADRRYRRT